MRDGRSRSGTVLDLDFQFETGPTKELLANSFPYKLLASASRVHILGHGYSTCA